MRDLLWKILAGAAVLAVITGLWLRSEYHAERARANAALLSSALAIGNANAEVARIQADRVRRIDAVAAVNAVRKRDLRAKSDIRRKEIMHAPPQADGPLAPILRDQLDRLPERPHTDADRDFAGASDPGVASAPSAGPYRPAADATQRDAALVVEDFIEALAACNADKDAIRRLFN